MISVLCNDRLDTGDKALKKGTMHYAKYAYCFISLVGKSYITLGCNCKTSLQLKISLKVCDIFSRNWCSVCYKRGMMYKINMSFGWIFKIFCSYGVGLF